MPVIKRKLSTSGWILIALAIVAIISLPILHFVGVIDLSFLGTGFSDVLTWAASDAMNGILFVSGVFLGGALTFYAIKTYLIGTQIPMTTQYPAYMPSGQTVSNPQQNNEETVVS